MITPTAEQCERAVGDVLTEVRQKFVRALTATGERGNAFSVLEQKFHVDQARRVLTDATGEPWAWMDWNGQKTLCVTRRVDRGRLSLYVAGNRFIPVETAFLAFADISTGKRLRNSANIPGLFNLFAIEGLLFPERDLAIWVTAARLLETGNEEDMHDVLPPVNTEFDRLHGLLPAESEPEYRLRPAESRNRKSWPGYQMSLLGQVLPNVADEAAKVVSDAQANRLFETHSPRLKQYVRDQLFARLARAIESADGHYVLLYPPED